ncbi:MULTISPECIES: LysR family transcriptional regulator [Paraburkholderia]|uniref:LysR family transcriptional regulator n=2 Tax=Burkholderiaceae TaxID=119060 RepID=A0A1A5XMU4_9BURK|nr:MULTISPECIES: LysR substrate-binding domain-containing protein [Paraburkholderia]MBB2978477.1 DNA-binding transcriptional LysR family regulator [Paraburkholderia tropica]MBB2998671.1 DNA-binding transcriptional LysR family regulator [Paraburkholderia tropica]MBB6318554.1 DNA-binding transcriptional LysR family regulator [Paraburkholderia tropica]MDE1139471.1 LysR substrate-binding domain-containing protein [Paraburkholderia tropica]OBR54468.1 LysR family transcriptional regulator [Paraburkh
MRLRHIEVFHAIMRTGSLSKAAELLCVSQPAVSKVLAHAERSAGLKLFARAHGRLQPTREAELLFAETQKLQTSLDSIRDLARNLALQPQGLLRIGCLPSLGLSLIPQAVQAFRASYPEVSLQIQTRHTNELFNALLTRELDVGVAINPPARPGIASLELGRTAVVCVAPPDEPTPADAPLALQDVVASDWISIGNVDPLGETIGHLLETQGVEGRLAVVEAQTWYVARSLAARGVGRVLLDEITAKSAGEPVAIRRVEPALSVGVFALWRDGGMDSQAGNAFVDVLRAGFAQA